MENENIAADEAAIGDLITEQISSWDAGDPNAYADAYTPDGDCVSFLGGHYRGRAAIAASAEVPRPGSRLKKLMRGAHLEFRISNIRFLTPDVALIHATGGLTRQGRSPSRRSRRINTSVAVLTADGVADNKSSAPANCAMPASCPCYRNASSGWMCIRFIRSSCPSRGSSARPTTPPARSSSGTQRVAEHCLIRVRAV